MWKTIESNPLWEAYRNLALEHNLRACWSHPIFCTTGRLLGTFAMYYNKPCTPSSYELDLIKKAANLSALAIERKQQDEALHSIATGTASMTNREFFRSLVYHFSIAMHVRFAVLTEWIDHTYTKVRTLAFWTGDDFAENMEYESAGTPCENVLAGNMSFYADNVQTSFPEDKVLLDLGVKSYLGLPLFDSSGSVLGHIAVLDDSPMSSDPRGMSILKIFAARAGAELERRLAVKALQKANTNLEKRVMERTIQLSNANKKLKQEVTEHQETQHMLKASEVRYRRIVDSAQEGIWMLRENGTTSFINQKMANILGYKKEEMRDLHFFDFLSTCARKNAEQYLTRIKNGAAEKHEFSFRRKNGSRCWTIISANPLTDDNGQTLGTLCMISDITERKRLEKEILEISNWEQRRIGQDLHDDLGQLLTGIALKGKALERKLIEESSGEATHATEIVKLTNQAIDKSHKVASGLCPVELEANGLMSALQEIATNIDSGGDISCTFQCDNPVAVYSNSIATHLYRIAQEATHNAIKHSQGKRVLIGLKKENNQVIMSVRDDGIGFKHPSTRGKTMGLHLMNYRATLINARLDMCSNPNRGTSVTCVIPDDKHHTVD